MIKYKYSLLRDLQELRQILTTEREFLKNSSVVTFWPSPLRWVWTLGWFIFAKKPQITTEKDYVCYVLSCGSWGRYYAGTNEFAIVPWKAECPPGGLEKTLRHEIIHLNHPEWDSLPHDVKEQRVEFATDHR